ncbi:MAG TPA: EamA family transporter RarD [Jiangellales bacterium]|nr:EamA family transporter RarD [Jiangellales bacterium]
MSTTRHGALYGVAAYTLWGLFPLYWPLLEPAGAVEILAHRIVWSLVVVVVLLSLGGRLAALRRLGRRAYVLLSVAAVVITVNWGTYIWGVNNEHVVETSLGYFVNPLVTVLMGVVVLGERLRPAQWGAVALASVAVIVLTLDYGRPPWIALTLAFSFATYGLLKKKAGVGAAESLAVETGVLVLPAAAYLLWLGARGAGTFGTQGLGHAVLLAGAGLVTAVPLLFFSAAATRVPLTTLGLLQYLAPTFQFAIGVFLYGEPLPPVRLVGFVLVWAALAVFTVEVLEHRRRQIRLAVQAAAT